jgi:hypothetical protein
MTRDLFGMPTDPSQEELRKFAKSFKLHVTQKDVDGAKCGDPANCIIARALLRQLSCEYVTVNANEAKIKNGAFFYYHHTPTPALHLVQNFDEIGAREGEVKARAAMPRRITFLMKFLKIRRVPPPRPPMNPEQKAQRKGTSTPRAPGLVRYNRRKRYVGI